MIIVLLWSFTVFNIKSNGNVYPDLEYAAILVIRIVSKAKSRMTNNILNIFGTTYIKYESVKSAVIFNQIGNRLYRENNI